MRNLLLSLTVCLALTMVPLFAAEPPAPAVQGDFWTTMFPDGLQDKDGQPANLDLLKGKIVGIYFSAHWCPPCKAFSPKLVEFRDKNNSDFEVVFVSSDKDESAQKEYMKEVKMNWPTVKLQSDAENAIGEKYGVQSIPTLIILDQNGKTISDQGRGEVAENPEKCLEEWKAKAK